MTAVWRIATDAPGYTADDLTGAGAKLSGGRWNRPGSAMLYCASNISLAVLETFVHLKAGGLPLNRYLVELTIPDAVWNSAISLAPPPVSWDAIPAGKVSLDEGDRWLIRPQRGADRAVRDRRRGVQRADQSAAPRRPADRGEQGQEMDWEPIPVGRSRCWRAWQAGAALLVVAWLAMRPPRALPALARHRHQLPPACRDRFSDPRLMRSPA